MVKQVDDLPANRLGNPQNRPHHQPQTGASKRPQDQLGGQPVPVQPAKELAKTFRLIGSVGQQEQDRLPLDLASKKVDKVQTRIIASVKVLENDQQGTPAGILPEEPGQDLKEPACPGFRLKRRARADLRQKKPELWNKFDQLWPEGPDQLSDCSPVPAGKG